MLEQNDYFDLFIEKSDVVIRSKKIGYPLKSFDMITKLHPRLKISSFASLRTALTVIGEARVIGHWLPLVEATVSDDKMNVKLRVNATSEDIEEKKRNVLTEARMSLEKIGVLYGVQELSLKSFSHNVIETGAVGKPAVNGEDAIIKYIERPVRRPVIREDGSANHYEMNFVFQVAEGDWLGEKTLAGDGEDGINVYGNVIPAIKGGDLKLQYDRKSVIETNEDGKIVIRAMHDGALEFINDQVVVGKHLLIEGDVGVGTGSLVFDGSITVKGSVHAGYSVVATDNISIEGNEGIVNAELIQSTKGGVYIKGGIFGGGLTLVEAKESIFIKHANNCKLVGKEVHVGLYLFGSDVFAEEVFVKKNEGKIIGGKVEALYTIECSVVGNNLEKETILQVSGMDQKTMNDEIRDMAQNLKKHQGVVAQLEQHKKLLNNDTNSLHKKQQEAYEKVTETIEINKSEILRIDNEIQLYFEKIKNVKKCQIEVVNEAYPGTVIQIGSAESTLRTITNGVFKIVDGVLNV